MNTEYNGFESSKTIVGQCLYETELRPLRIAESGKETGLGKLD